MKKFSELPVGAIFICYGNRCEKRSTRTALLLEYGRVFYFGADDPVILEKA